MVLWGHCAGMVLWYCGDVVWYCGDIVVLWWYGIVVLWWVTLCWGMIMLLLSGRLLPAGDGHQMAKFSFWDLLQLPHIINGW